MNLLSRLQNSVSKRIFWRTHLSEAQAELQRLRQELPTLEMMLAIPYLFRGKGFFGSLRLKQNMMELLGLAKALERLRPQRVCEIGTFKGGTLFIWCQLAAPDALIVSVDLPGGPFGGGYSEKSLPLFQSFRKPGQRLECIRGSSHDLNIRNQFRHALGSAQLDFLFIDGDHSYEGAKSDFDFYSPFVRRGGIVAFHDICTRDELPNIQVHRLWAELKPNYRHEEFIDSRPNSRKIGIGMLYVE